MSTTSLLHLLTLLSLCQPVPKEAGPDPYILNETIDVVAKRAHQSEPTAAIAEAVEIHLDAGNFDPVSEDGIPLTLTVEWDYTDDSPREVQAIYVDYRAGPFAGRIKKTRQNLPAGRERVAPKHRDLADLAVQELVYRWKNYKQWAEMFARGLKGAPKP